MENVLWHMSDARLDDPYQGGIGFGRALADEMATYEWATKMLAARFKSGGRPDLLVSLVGADAAEVQDRELQFNAAHVGPWNYKRAWFTNASLDVRELSQSFEEMGVLSMLQFDQEVMRLAMGIPPEIMGDAKGSNRATIDAAENIFAAQALVPQLEDELEFYSARLLPEFHDPEAVLLEYVSPVPRDREHELAVMVAFPGDFTVDEVREAAGHQPLQDGQGRLFHKPFATGFAERIEVTENVAPTLAPVADAEGGDATP